MALTNLSKYYAIEALELQDYIISFSYLANLTMVFQSWSVPHLLETGMLSLLIKDAALAQHVSNSVLGFRKT